MAMMKQGEAFWYYKVFGLNALKKDNFFDYDLKFQGRGIIGAKLQFSNSGELICAGMYGEMTRKGSLTDFDGIFYAKLNPLTGSIIADNHKKIDKSIIEFMTSKSNAEKDRGLNVYSRIKDIVPMDNGTTNLLIESTHNIQYNSSIIVANIASDGEIGWIKLIPRNIKNDNAFGAYGSFTYFKAQNNLKFLFTDNSENYNESNGNFLLDQVKNINEIKSSKKHKSIALVEIDEKGNTERKLLVKLNKHNLRISSAIWSNSGKEIFAITHFKNKSDKHVMMSRLTF